MTDLISNDFAPPLAQALTQQTVQIVSALGAFQTLQKSSVNVNASTRSNLNVIPGAGITLTTADDPTNDAAKLTISCYPALFYAYQQLSGDVALTNANQFYDGPTASISAGTWFAVANVTVLAGTNAGSLTAKLWDGVATIASGETKVVASTTACLTLAGIFSGVATLHMAAAFTQTGATIKAAAPDNAVGNGASSLWTVRIQ